MQVEIKNIDALSVAKVCFVLYAVLGIVVSVLYLIFALAMSGVMDYGSTFGESWILRTAATGFGILLIPLFALIYGCFGALGGLIFALIYNLVAKAMGGLRLRLTGEAFDVPIAGGGKSTEVRL